MYTTDGQTHRKMFLRAIAECLVRLTHGLSVCPSVRHTAVQYCIKTVQARITKSSLCAVAKH